MHDTRRNGNPLPIILDVDTGVDDALAILYACASPEIDLRGVTCVAGNTELPDVVANTSALLAMAGRGDVPVCVGAARALLRTPVGRDNSHVHGGAGRGYAELPDLPTRVSDQDACAFLIDQARAHPGELTVIATGPLTNLAIAVRREPTLPHLLKQLIFMGGAFQSPGNTTPVAEFNIHADPEAASIVLDAFRSSSRRPIALGLDVTHQVKLLPQHIQELASQAGESLAVSPDMDWGRAKSPILRYLAGALRQYAEYHQRLHGFYGTYLHDPLTVAVAVDPGLVTTQPVAVQVECQGSLTAGQTVADWKNVWGLEPNVDVAVRVRADAALTEIIARLATVIRNH